MLEYHLFLANVGSRSLPKQSTSDHLIHNLTRVESRWAGQTSIGDTFKVRLETIPIHQQKPT